MKRYISLILSFLMLLQYAAAAANLKNFKKVNTYAEGQFEDVSADAWYAENVKAAFEFGLINGMSDVSFAPERNITVFETIVLACRLHSIYNGLSTEFKQGSPWYGVYVDYAVENGICANPGESGNAPATRAYFAKTLAASVDSSALEELNEVTLIPDIYANADYVDAVYSLYRAGILTGSDDAGSFFPDNSIKRCEVAAIVTRIADPYLRKGASPRKAYEKSDNRIAFESLYKNVNNAYPHFKESYFLFRRAIERDDIFTASLAQQEMGEAFKCYEAARKLCMDNAHLRDYLSSIDDFYRFIENKWNKSLTIQDIKYFINSSSGTILNKAYAQYHYTAYIDSALRLTLRVKEDLQAFVEEEEAKWAKENQ